MEAPYAAWYLGGTLNACYKPGVRRIRDAAELTGDDVWITVTVPGDFQGAQGDPRPGRRNDPAVDQRALLRWAWPKHAERGVAPR
jgi:hypothetical protein